MPSKKVALVIPSIQKLDNLMTFNQSLNRHEVYVLVIDEGDEGIREYNENILEWLGVHYWFYGPDERADILGPDVDVIPVRAHAETSFGFYQAFQEGAEVVIELDDDCFVDHEGDFVAEHLVNLSDSTGDEMHSKGKWINPLRYMGKTWKEEIFPRGYPYAPEVREGWAYWGYREQKPCVLNMGLWSGQPDLDAATILSQGGLNGRSDVKTVDLEPQFRKTIVGKGNFTPICSMNTSFRAEIIPAFYQMYMNYENLDRYCDIWSGIFIKKIADHLDKKICLGAPTVEHRKTERSTFKDLRAEHEGMAITEILWKTVRDLEIEGVTYWDAYDSLTVELNCRIDKDFTDLIHRKLMKKQIEKMAKWLRLFE